MAVDAPSTDASSLGGGPGLGSALDRALRSLAAARAGQYRDLPHPVIAWLGGGQLTLHFAAGDTAAPPGPWRASEDGGSWSCELGALGEHPRLADTDAPYPGLLAVGAHAGYELFVDFEQAPGPVSLDGDADRARDIALALAAHAATCAWSDGTRVTLVGFEDGAQATRLASRPITSVACLGGVLAEVEAERERLVALARHLGVEDVLAGRQAGRDPVWRPRLLVLSSPPTAEQAQRLSAVVGAGRSSVMALVVGETPAARWRFTVERSGRLELAPLGLRVHAHVLDESEMGWLVALADGAVGRV